MSNTEDSAELSTLVLDVQDLANDAALNLYRNNLNASCKALDAIRERLAINGKGEPAGWLYTNPDESKGIAPVFSRTRLDNVNRWIERPLYAAPE